MDSVQDLKRLLYERAEVLKKREEKIEALEKLVEERENTICYLQNEIDKFRQIVELSINTVALNPRLRAKRQAISAEPSSYDTEPLVKFTKPGR